MFQHVLVSDTCSLTLVRIVLAGFAYIYFVTHFSGNFVYRIFDIAFPLLLSSCASDAIFDALGWAITAYEDYIEIFRVFTFFCSQESQWHLLTELP